MTAYCADCGLQVEWDPIRNRWASRTADYGNVDVWSFLCRQIRRDGTLIAADYHHLPGEPQEHFHNPNW